MAMGSCGYDVVAHEFPGQCTGVDMHDGRLLFAHGPRVTEFENGRVTTLVEEAPAFRVSFRIDGDMLRMSQEPLDDVHKPTLFRSSVVSDLTQWNANDYNMVSAVSAGDHRICYDEAKPMQFRWVSVSEGGSTTDLACEGSPVGDKEAVFFQTDTELVRFTPDLAHRVWGRELGGKRNVNLRPFTHGDSVVICTVSEGGEHSMISTNKVSGEESWRRVFAGALWSMRLGGGYVLAFEQQGDMWVLEPSSGAVLGRGNVGLRPSRRTGNSFLWSDGRSLFAVNRSERVARVFSMDASRLIQEIQLPNPYSFGAPGKNFARVGEEGEIYWVCPGYGELSNQSFLMAVLTPRSSGEGRREPPLTLDVQTPPWPIDVHVHRVPSAKKGKVHYHITVRARHAHEVERYGQIALRWTVAARAGLFSGDYRRDSRLDGSFLFSTESAEESPERLQRTLDEVAYSFRLTKGEWLKLSLAPMPESSPGEEHPVGVLNGELRFRKDAWLEKMPLSVATLCGRALRADPNLMFYLHEQVVALGKRYGRKRFRGAELAFRECSRGTMFRLEGDDGRAVAATQVLYDDFENMTFEDFAEELRKGATDAYRRVGSIFFDDTDCARWFLYLGKLAKTLCKGAQEGDSAVAAVFDLVAGLEEEGRMLARDVGS